MPQKIFKKIELDIYWIFRKTVIFLKTNAIGEFIRKQSDLIPYIF